MMLLKRSSFILMLALFFLTGCPSSKTQEIKKTPDKPKVTKKEEPILLPKKKKILPPRHALVPKNVLTFRLKKGIPWQAYLYADGTLRPLPPKGKNWKPVFIQKHKERSWFAVLNPDKGVKLGLYTVIHLIIAVYSGTAGYQRSAFFSARFYIRRGSKRILLFKSFIRASGARYKLYRLYNRELNESFAVQKGDVLEFCLVHTRGATGAVGIGGGTNASGSQLVISPNQIGNYYQFTN